MTAADDYYNEMIDLRREVANLQQLLKAAQDALAIVSKRGVDAAILLARVTGHELGVHRIGDKDPYYVSWDDGEYWIEQALNSLTNSYENEMTGTELDSITASGI